MKFSSQFLLLTAAILGFSPLVHGLSADTNLPPSLFEAYLAQGLDEDLLDMFSGSWKRDPTYLAAIGYYKPFSAHKISNIKFIMGMNVIGAKHRGLQSNYELDVALNFKILAVLPENKYLNFDLGWGIGLSNAFGNPAYEDGSEEDPERRYRFQGFMLFDLDFFRHKSQKYRVFCRIHHRSGIYGLIAPEKVGSNFFGCGLKFNLE